MLMAEDKKVNWSSIISGLWVIGLAWLVSDKQHDYMTPSVLGLLLIDYAYSKFKG